MTYLQEDAPHIRSAGSSTRIFAVTLASLTPLLIVNFFMSGPRALLAFAAAMITSSVIFAAQSFGSRKKSATFFSVEGFLVPALLAAALPEMPWPIACLGALVSVFLGRQIFGGLGGAVFHPSLVGILFLCVGFPEMTKNFSGAAGTEQIRAIAAAVGGTFLVARKKIRWDIPLIYLSVFAAFVFIFQKNPAAFLFPEVFLGAFYFTADPLTTPMTRSGQRFFSASAALIAGLAAAGGLYRVEALALGVLAMNALTPWLDRWFRPKGVLIK